MTEHVNDVDATEFDAAEFDATGPLPTGTTVLEASAGTGKTYAIVSLAVRYLADGVDIDRLLMVTFSRAASNELRERMRSRIAECLAALDDPSGDADDEVIAALRAGSDAEVDLRRRRLDRAMSDFDAATVATTHTFCNRMLSALGFLGERTQGYPIEENVDDLVAELARDLYLARFAGDVADAPPIDVVTKVTKEAVAEPLTRLAPTADEADEAAGVRLELARDARAEITARKRLARIRTYDDLQNVLHAIVTDLELGPVARDRIREQFSVVLIDEFQDTDPQQWDIVRTCFHGQLPLVLVGDPKQSIYAFRGAEVRSYLNAVQEADSQQRLGTNWRSDGPLVDALGTLFTGAAFGHPQIAFHPVHARQSTSRVHAGAEGEEPAEAGAARLAAPLRIRMFLESDLRGPEQAHVLLRRKVTEDVADDIAALLNSPVTIDAPGGRRRVQPGDVAILVRANSAVEPLQGALAERGIASVVRSGMSIFKTPAARHWWYVLEAIEQPSRSSRVRLAALTPLLGVDAADLDAGGDEKAAQEREFELAGTLAELGRVFTEGGFASMAARLYDHYDTERRVLSSDGGERLLTDLRQLADLANRRATSHAGGLPALVAWLAEQIDDRSGLRHGGAQTRRLDRDTRAVQIMTIHASKGLEFPIVYAPFAWDGARRPSRDTFAFHADGIRHLDVGGLKAPGARRREALALAEDAGEDLRLLYVALTRARSQVVTWWGPSFVTDQGALHRLLFTAQARARAVQAGLDAQPIDLRVPLPSDDQEAIATVREVVAGAGAAVSVEAAGRHESTRWAPDGGPAEAPELAVAEFTRDIDQQWRRTSYSAIVADAHARAYGGESLVQIGSEAEDGLVEDEPTGLADDPAGEPAAGEPAAGGTPSLMNGLPFGAGFGTLVHDVLEHIDTGAVDLAVQVRERTAEGALRRGVEIDVDRLATALLGVLTTPLGFGDLASIGPADRLAEVDFELPLAAPGFGLDAVGDLLAEHLPADDPLRDYAEVVRGVSAERFRGYLTGSIDSVLRTADGRFVVVDYKTNRLRPGDLTVEDFGAQAMAAEMMTANYPLQALLYSVALHRYLRWRLPDYEPSRHLGPVQYHFVRGMSGPQNPPGCGVFEWHPPAALVQALSDLLAGVDDGRQVS